MATGGGVDCLYGASFGRNVLFARNTFRLMHGWDREAMTTDAGYGAYYGKLKRAEGRTIVLAGEANWKLRTSWAGAGVFILGGRGMGQYREIAAVADDGVTVTLDRPWDVPPDDNSIISITFMQRNYVFVENHFEDAGIAIQYYGTSINHVAAGNTCVRAGGFYNSGRWYRHFQPSWYCQFLDNEIRDGNCYRFGPNNATDAGPSFLGTWGLQTRGNTTPLAYCSVLRRNKLRENAHIQLVGVSAEHNGVRDVVVERNLVENSRLGIRIDRGCAGVWLRDNKFNNVAAPMGSDEEAAAKRLERRKRLLAETGPVAWFSFEEPIGRFVPDESGYNFDASIRGQVQFVDGVRGKAAKFDGNGYLFVEDEQNLLLLPRFTIAAWIRLDQRRGRWGIVAKRAANQTCPYVLAVRDGRLCFEAADADGQWSYNFYSEPVIEPGKWYHVAATCEAGRRVRLYCSGKLVAEKHVALPLCAEQRPLTIGFEARGGPESRPEHSGNFRGLIDEVRIWARVLSEQQLRAEFERSSPKCSGS
ncbi:MAG TPA: LamG domain-containing protein [Planctomycetaceae bacterium]|nr:LamG domain-containing protein [Planctomycetaceae bacterium]